MTTKNKEAGVMDSANGHKIHLGIFLCEIVAAARYDIEAEKLFEQFAKTNF